MHLQRTKLLAINFGGIGDEILFLPTLDSIKKVHPDWHITLLVEPRSQSVAQVTSLIDASLTFDIKKRPLTAGDLCDLLWLIKDGSFDILLSSGSSPAVAALLFLSGVPVRVGYATSFASTLLLTNPVALNRQQYAAYMYHDLVSGLGIVRKAESPALTLPPDSIARAKLLLSSAKGATAGGEATCRVLIHPGTSRLALEKGIIKTWAIDNWVELIARLCACPQIQPVLSGGPDDSQTVEAIARASSGLRLLSAVGATAGLSDLAALISQCDLLVCVDSAPMHLAVAAGKSLVALFGPTDPSKLLPSDQRFRWLQGHQQTTSSPQRSPVPYAGQSLSNAPGVLIQPDIVFQAVMDQLNATSVQESSQAAGC